MSYLKQIWRDLVSGGTTLTADRLNHMEDGIAAANDAWDSVSPVMIIDDGKVSVQQAGCHIIACYRANVGDIPPWGTIHLKDGLPKPTKAVSAAVTVQDASAVCAIATIGSDGTLLLDNKSSASGAGWVFFEISYFTT